MSDALPVRQRFSDFITDLPILQAESAQLGRGVARFMSVQACGRDMILTHLLLEPRLAGHVVPDPQWLCLMVPLRWRGDYVFNGITARPCDIYLSAGPNGYATVGEGRETIAVGIRRSRLQQTIMWLAGNSIEPLQLVDQRLALGATYGPHVQRKLLAAIRGAMLSPIAATRFALSRTVESDLFSLLGSMLLDQMGCENERDACRMDALRVVKAAKQALQEQPAQTASLAELCAASGVGQTWLHKCFVDIYGTAPNSYLRSRRLTAARECLLDPIGGPRSVKEVALSHGFPNFGRFAADYRARFEEYPSETLARQNQHKLCRDRSSQRTRSDHKKTPKLQSNPGFES